MAYDGLFTVAMTKELQKLATGRIARIHQPNAQEIVFTVRANGRNDKLLFSVHPSYARVQITEQSIENPPEPPMFCTLLRKHIEGGFIESIEQLGADRVIVLTITSTNEIGDPITRKLYAEIMGRHSNLILVDTENGKIVDSLKHLPPSVNSYRTVLPGFEYVEPPAQDRENPLTITLNELDGFFGIPRDPKEIMNHFVGFSPLHAKEFVHRAEATQTPMADLFQPFIQQFKDGGVSPTYAEIGNKVVFSPIELTHLDVQTVSYPSLSSLLDRVFFARAERDRVKQQAGDLERWLHSETNKLKLKLKKLDQDLKRAQNLDEYQLYGELLMANLYAFEKGPTEVTVTNYYTNEPVTIPISVRKTPIENAKSYYAKYTKFKHALIKVQQQIDKTKEDLSYFDMITQQVEQAAPADIEEIREELADQGYMKLKKSKRRKKPTKPQPETYVSSTGTLISVGKNNKQNDYLTFKLSRRDDIWMHTKDIPGSHVVIHTPEPDEPTIREAANLAAYFSKARDSSSVPVDYTQIRHVKKPNGSKPGFVIFFEQKTIFIDPDEDAIMKLEKK